MKFKTYINEGLVSGIVAIKFIKLLTSNFEKWDLFKSGGIDEDGKIIDKKIKIDTFENIARKIKILFNKFVPNKKYLTLLLAMYLLKKEDIIHPDPVENLLKEQLDNNLSEDEKQLLIKLLKEVTSTSAGVGKYDEKIFVGKDLENKVAYKLGIKKIKKDHRGYKYNKNTGFIIFI